MFIEMCSNNCIGPYYSDFSHDYQTYDLSLEQFAQSYLDGVNGCPLQHNPQEVYGENLYLGYSFGNAAYTVDYKSIVSGWHNEYYYYDYNNNKCNAPPNKSCGHYKQV